MWRFKRFPSSPASPSGWGFFWPESWDRGRTTLRSAASDPHFLVSVLYFVLRDDETVKAFAKASQHHPTTIAAARQALGERDRERDVP